MRLRVGWILDNRALTDIFSSRLGLGFILPSTLHICVPESRLFAGDGVRYIQTGGGQIS